MEMDTNTPLVSIIIPFYNAESTIEKCLISVIKQSYSNIEIICVDDGSKDASVSIIKSHKDDRIVLFQKENGGNYSARNMGLDKAKGEFITMVDADDYISTDYIEKNIQLFLKDKELDIVQIPWIMVDEQDKVVSDKKISCRTFKNETEYLRAYFENIITPLVTNKLIRASVYNNIRFPLLKCSGDSYIQPELARYARKTYLSDVGCYYYYQNPQSITKTKYTIEKTEGSLKMHCHTYDVLYNNVNLCDLRSNRFLLAISMLGFALREFGYEFSEPYIKFFAERRPTFSDVLHSKIPVKKKAKIFLLIIIGIQNYCKIVE